MESTNLPAWSPNEWDPLKEVIVGVVKDANIPSPDLSHLATNHANLTWEEYTQLPRGRYPEHVYEETEEDLEGLVSILEGAGVNVLRPSPVDFTKTVSNGLWATEQYEAYCPRDSVMVAGDAIIESAMGLRARFLENYVFRDICIDKMRAGSRWLPMPKPMLKDDTYVVGPGLDPSINNYEPLLDMANCIRCGYDIFALVSNTGNQLGIQWLQQALGDKFRVHPLENLYSWAHIDSTIMPLRPGLVIMNSSRVKKESIPEFFRNWDIIWYGEDECVGQPCLEDYAPASKWIGMNVLSVSPELVIVPEEEVHLIKSIEANGVTVAPVRMRHMRTLAGGPHCVTCDLRRDGTLESYYG